MGLRSRLALAGQARWDRTRWWAVALVLLLIAVGCLSWGLRGPSTSLAAPGATAPSSAVGATSTAATSDPATPSSTTVAEPPPPSIGRSAPIALRIPAIGLDVSLSALGLNGDGTVQVPTDFQEPGWFRLGPSPGESGSAVILGHVDSYQGPAVFFRIESLRTGDQVDVTLANGVVVHFAVDMVESYPKLEFPAQQVYGSHGYSALQLVTCGGDFDYNTRHYLSNIVAYTRLVGTTP